MPQTIDWEPHSTPRPKSVGWKFWSVAALLALIFLFGRSLVSLWVELLWFSSLGQPQVFWTAKTLQWGTFLGFTAATFLYLYILFRLLLRVHREELPQAHTIVIGGRPLTLSLTPVLHIGGGIVSFLVALAAGGTMAAGWQTLALWWRAPQAGGALDPIFSRPLSFYLFTLPAWNLLLGWLLALAILSCLFSVLFLAIAGGVRVFNSGLGGQSLPLRSLASSGAFLMAVASARVNLSRYDLLTGHHTIFDGITYADAHVQLAGKLAIALALLFGALVALTAAVLGPRLKHLIVALAPTVVTVVGVGLAGWYVSVFVVKPNELVREQPYIAQNIAMTRQAFALDRFDQREFPAEITLDATEPDKNQLTLNNIRLWDWHALQDTLRQIQEIRTYYDFPDIDIDRYPIMGQMRQVMLAARELNVDKLPESSRNWINEKLVYTHGYGITMNPVNGFTPEGLPTLLLSNMPVQSTVPGLNLTRPEIYYGEQTTTDVYVRTRQKEFNYPQGDQNNFTTYEGSGGIPMGGFMRRILIALDRGDLAKVPFSDDIGSDSRLLMRRQVRERVLALAPFLTTEHDPYLVLGDDGRLSWILDAFTTTDAYPYSTHYTAGNQQVNYIRNSVKAVVDAYSGAVHFYVFDTQDPILAAWRAIFPTLFEDGSKMPADLRQHIRYPELLLKLQAEVYGLYHMTNPEVFYNREDLWTVASEIGLGENGEQSTQPMQPNFVLMKLPGEQQAEFVEILPFTPSNRNNMIGWIAGRSDGAHYGDAVVYDFPKTRLVDGPQQIESRIDQNAQLSGQLTLWNQQGSHVRRGTLLVIPLGRALLYAEPIYLQAARSPMPELRLVVLALQDRLAYGPTFEAALSSLYGSSAPNLNAPESAAKPGSNPAAAAATPPADTLKKLTAEASQDFDDYQRLTAQGKLGEAGQKLEALKQALTRLSAQAR